MSSDLTPQVGDIWEWTGDMRSINDVRNTFVIKYAGAELIVVTYLNCLTEVTICYDTFNRRDSRLIERDGKPYEYKREFECGAWYPVKIKDSVIPCQFDEGDFCVEGLPISRIPLSQISACDIGDKIEFKGLS